ncbi:uncharacterized protein B0P05DRAFT_553620 [Gilbertella persicaria]|uniref:uncharacterized protein n=1 Tax=Gilbertella persicaria TaxID=101096 RepID=UPI00222040D0|nr:uncharacterized protein B0P05DRAFT_553620 [Gilbertella persicaria]KAI8066263.1 hypothetical protein B0P05DRAFT_553620 [Gilbertella persicaria]
MSYTDPNSYQPRQEQTHMHPQQHFYDSNYTTIHDQNYRPNLLSPMQQQQLPPPQLQQQEEPYQQLYESRKLFSCEEPGCSEYFEHMVGLKTHQRTTHGRKDSNHVKEEPSKSPQTRPYICPYAECGKAFTQYGNLRTHSRKHTGERPYHCTYDGCDKAFTQLGNLKTHEKIHWPVKPFVCTYPNCGKGFTQRGNLKTHQIKVHQIVPYKVHRIVPQ